MKNVSPVDTADPAAAAAGVGVSGLPPLRGLAPDSDEHPLHRIAADQEALIKECARLEIKLKECTDQAYKEKKALLLDMLEVMDGFDRLFRNLEERAATLETQTKMLAGNFRTVRRLLSLALERIGVNAMEAEPGSPVDPRIHEVVETRPTPGEPDNLILEVIQAGYFWNDEVLRYAKLAAGKNLEEV